MLNFNSFQFMVGVISNRIKGFIIDGMDRKWITNQNLINNGAWFTKHGTYLIDFHHGTCLRCWCWRGLKFTQVTNILNYQILAKDYLLMFKMYLIFWLRQLVTAHTLSHLCYVFGVLVHFVLSRFIGEISFFRLILSSCCEDSLVVDCSHGCSNMVSRQATW